MCAGINSRRSPLDLPAPMILTDACSPPTHHHTHTHTHTHTQTFCVSAAACAAMRMDDSSPLMPPPEAPALYPAALRTLPWVCSVRPPPRIRFSEGRS